MGSTIDELLQMSRRMKDRLEHAALLQHDLVERLSEKVSNTNELLRAAGEIAKV